MNGKTHRKRNGLNMHHHSHCSSYWKALSEPTKISSRNESFPPFQKAGAEWCIPLPTRSEARLGELPYFLPKFGWVRYRNSRQVVGIVKNVTVSHACGKWYISIQTECDVSDPIHPSTSMVRLDAGMAKLATLSDGTIFEPINSFQKKQKRLAKLQRQLSQFTFWSEGSGW